MTCSGHSMKELVYYPFEHAWSTSSRWTKGMVGLSGIHSDPKLIRHVRVGWCILWLWVHKERTAYLILNGSECWLTSLRFASLPFFYILWAYFLYAYLVNETAFAATVGVLGALSTPGRRRDNSTRAFELRIDPWYERVRHLLCWLLPSRLDTFCGGNGSAVETQLPRKSAPMAQEFL